MNRRASGGVLILSHQGYSFLEDLARQIRAADLAVYVLSSALAPGDEGRRQTLEGLSDWLYVVDDAKSLSSANIDRALETLKASQRGVICCISVWDGYRSLMARVNASLGAPDVSSDAVNMMNDKLEMRRRLYECGLTQCKAQAASAELCAQMASEGLAVRKRRFVKPRRGLASFAAFEYKEDLSWSELELLRGKIAADPEYSEVLSEHPEFIIEDYIDGREMSFEMIAVNGKAYALGVHEKVGLESGQRTTLETACVSPPLSLSPIEMRAGIEYVGRVMSALGALTGCYHIEVRKSENGSWDTIEVNPRVGGAFINQSVKSLTGGSCLLQLWLATLLRHDTDLELLQLQAICRPWCSSVFRVFFGEGGKTLATINTPDFEPRPSLTRIIAKCGVQLHDSEREIFIGQILWTLPTTSDPSTISNLVNNSKKALEFTYV